VKYARINEAPRAYLYLPFQQAYRPNMILHVRGPSGAAALMEQARAHVSALDPQLPILDARSLREQTSAALAIYEMTAAMLLMFGAAAMGLAAMGMYGLVAHTVRLSTHGIGIRMALGASRGNVVGRFLVGGLRLSMAGVALGLIASLTTTRLLGALLYGVSATDTVSFAMAFAVVLGSATLATVVPAWHAARTNPMVALRRR
jgi:putative ABC transport system permease protein